MNVLVIGASVKPERYSNIAINMLNEFNHNVFAIGLRKAVVNNVDIETEHKNFENIDTVTLYLNEHRQTDYYNYIIGLKPRRIIFNPGTENSEFYKLLDEAKIKYEVACTLVLLRTGLF